MSKVDLTCQKCNKTFSVPNKKHYLKQKYCSRKCYFEDNQNVGRKKNESFYEIRECIICGTPFEVRKKVKKTMCSDACRKEYNKIHRKEINQATKNAFLKKYGVDSPLKLDEIKEKRKKNNLEKYGVEYTLQLEEVKEKIKKTNLEKYGVEYTLQSEEVKEKVKKTNLEKYGVEYISQNEEIKEKVKKTNLKKYGVEYATQSDEIKEKIKKTNLEKYGVEYTLQSEEVKEKVKKTNLEKYGVEYISQLEETKEKINNTLEIRRKEKYNNRANKNNFDLIEIINPYLVKIKCKECGYEFKYTQLKSNKIPICRKCHPVEKESKLNKQFEEIIKDFNFHSNNREIIKPFEIDYLLIDKPYGFELNGNYWHSERYGEKDKNYHINKTTLAYKNGINLIHIFEDEMVDKYEIVKSRVLNKIGIIESKIYARKCIIKEIDKSEEKIFFDTTHIQGYTPSKYAYGLFINNKLVSAISFTKRKIGKNNNSDFELLRYSTELNIIVIGGFAKLLNHFIKELQPEKIITYCDIRWNGLNSNDNIYTKNSFQLVSQTPPNYWYVKTNNFIERKHRYNYRKSNLVKQGFDINKTEQEIMFENGYDRIWDCGSFKYELILK